MKQVLQTAGISMQFLLSLHCTVLVGWFLNLHFAQVFAEPHHDDFAVEI